MVDEATDAELVERCRNGDRGAFDRLVRRHERPVYHLALRMLRSPEDARDVVQMAFLKAWERLHAYDPQYKFFSWLYRIAVNESLDQLQRRRRFEPVDEQLADDGVGPERELGDSELAAGIDREIRRMKPEHQAVLLMKHFAGCSYQDIAQALELPEKTVKSRLFTARQQLRDALARAGLL